MYSGDFEILHEIVRDTTRISSCFSDFLVVSRTITCRISESPLHFISILTAYIFVLIINFFSAQNDKFKWIEPEPPCCLKPTQFGRSRLRDLGLPEPLKKVAAP